MKKRYLILGSLALVLAILLFFLSTLVKSYINKKGPELLGRKMALSELHFNYWNLAVKANGFAVFEKNDVDTFAGFKELKVDFSPWHLFQREYSFSEISLVDPMVNIEQYADSYNFTDLVPDFDTTAVREVDTTNVVKFSLHNIKLTGGEIHLYDQTVENRVNITNLNFDLPLIAWDNQKSNVGAGFNLGDQGTVQIDASMDNVAGLYEVDFKTTDVEINPVSNYLTDYFDAESLNGLLSSSIRINGSVEDLMNVQITGEGSLKNVSVVDGQGETILTAPEARVRIAGMDLQKFDFNFNAIEIDEPHLLVTREKDRTNMENFFAPLMEEDTTEAVEITFEKGEEVEASYTIDTIKVNNARLSFIDNTLLRPCHIELSDLQVEMNNMADTATQIPIRFSSNINKAGMVEGTTTINMDDPYDFSLDCHLKRMDLVSFSPYTEYYIASPFTQGWFSYDLLVEMGDGQLTNQNDILVEELEFGNRTSNKPEIKVPIRLALYVMKDGNDNIEIHLPVSGSTDDPEFRLSKIIWGAVLNVLGKAATSPFKALAGLVSADPEKLEYVKLNYVQDTLEVSQQQQLDNLVKILKKKPDLRVSMIQRTNAELEKLKLGVLLAKKQFMADKKESEMPADEDSRFVRFLSSEVPGADTLELEAACAQLVPASDLNMAFTDLLNRRNEKVSQYFATHEIPAENIHVSTADLRNLPEEIRRPEYKVEVSVK